MEPMKSLVPIVLVLSLALASCKLEPSAGAPSRNGNANANQDTSNDVAEQQPRSNCALTIAGAPPIQQLRLGMSPDEVLPLFPGSKDDPAIKAQLSRPASPLGVSEFVIHPDKLESKDRFKGISHLTFGLLDRRVSSINIGYNGPAYSNVDEFVKKVVAGTSLPPADQWQAYVGMDNQLKILTCQDFEIRVFTGGEGGNLNYVLMTDLEADKRLRDRRAKARAQASPSPTP